MITDFRDLAAGTEIRADLCIIGAGPAGIALARVLREGAGRIVVLESGGLEFDAKTQALAEGLNIGRDYFPLDACRLRFFGGTSNHWVGHSGPLDDIDFIRRRWVEHSGWPIRRVDLDPFYQGAQRLAELGPNEYDVSGWFDRDAQPPVLDPTKLDYRLWQFSPPTRFGERYRADLAEARDVEVFLHATATRLDTDPNGRMVRGILVRSLEGHSAIVRPRFTVIAGGGIENARLLLVSRRVVPEGLGNAQGLVGRFFMDHPHLETAEVVTPDSERLVPPFEEFTRGGVKVRVGFRPSAAAQAREAILNCGVNVSRISVHDTGYDALRRLAGALRNRRWPDQLARSVLRMIRDLDATSGVVDRMLGRPYRRPSRLILFARAEQAPNPDSRITLGASLDALGVPRAELDWRLSPVDFRSVRRTTLLVAEEIGRLGLGRVRLAEWLRTRHPEWPDTLAGGCHHMGTTRMAADPRDGVVDADVRVHGMSNLYVAGSSVFPTSGFMNPTLTIIALALRLAEHLRPLLRA